MPGGIAGLTPGPGRALVAARQMIVQTAISG
jgi:hypothetical protein